MVKAALNRKKTVFVCKFELNLRKELLMCFIFSIALYGVESWTLRNCRSEIPAYKSYSWTVLKCGAGEGWKRSVRPIMWKNKMCYIRSRRRGISCIQ